MIEPKEKDTLNPELDKRLDDLFAEKDIPVPESAEKNQQENYPLAELKNLIFSIDWEITDEVLDSLLQQLKDLQITYKDDKIVMTFLQILNSLSSYIQTQRAMAHPKTFKILNSVFSSLDKVVVTKRMTESEKIKTLRAEINRYKGLKAQIAKSKLNAARRSVKPKPVTALEQPAESFVEAARDELTGIHQQVGGDISATTLSEAVDEIKWYIHAEIKALKAEILSLREQK